MAKKKVLEVSEELLRNHFRMVYGSWHGCALRKNMMHKEDYDRGLKPGQLCDDCNSWIEAHIQDIKDGV